MTNSTHRVCDYLFCLLLLIPLRFEATTNIGDLVIPVQACTWLQQRQMLPQLVCSCAFNTQPPFPQQDKRHGGMLR